MRAIRIEEPGTLGLVEVPEPTPGPKDVVVEVKACGVCGTDLHILAGEFPPTPYPIIPGHEAAGVVAKVGSEVVSLSEGDRVGIDPSLFCGACAFCRVNRGNLCERWGAIGVTKDGAFAEYVKVPEANAYPIPPSVSFGAAALVEPVSCAVHAIDRLDIGFGDNVLIYGAGTMGLILAQLISYVSSSLVSLIDINPKRVNRAREFGFESVAVSLAELTTTPDGGYDRVVEATGVLSAVEEALGAVRRGGTMMVFGVTPPGETAAFEPFRIYNDEINIIGSMAVLASYGRSVDAVANGLVDADRMITNTFELGQFAAALDNVREGKGIKTHVTPSI
jgi:2-desacetyl-2-hydroxyethyl bacteriochlorophyllide A dehydrogenase